jgi:hypothetical protein
MAVVFFHLPRTGGSTVWHSAAHLAARHGLPAIDLFHHSARLCGSPHQPLAALRDIKAGAGVPLEGLIHHHSTQNITAELSPDEHHYATILRDPVDRFVSDIFHLRALMRRDQNFRAEITAAAAPESAEFLAALLDESASPDRLVLLAAEQPCYQNYYLNSFWQFLFAAPSCPRETPPMPEWVIPALAFAVRSRFCLIGRFPDIHGMVRQMIKLAGVENETDVQLTHVANGSPTPTLRPETIERLRELNRTEYRFLEELMRGPAPRPAPAQWETLNAELAMAKARSRSLVFQLEAMRDSRSWRVTRPLRAMRLKPG